MGEQLQKVSMKWSAATLQHEAELLNAFSGLVEGRSQLSRVTMKIAWRLVRTVGILRVIEEFVQDKPCETAPDLVAQSLTAQVPAFPVDGRAKPLTRIVAPPNKGVRGRAISHINPMDDVEVVGAWVPHFPGKVSPINSTPYARVA